MPAPSKVVCMLLCPWQRAVCRMVNMMKPTAGVLEVSLLARDTTLGGVRTITTGECTLAEAGTLSPVCGAMSNQ